MLRQVFVIKGDNIVYKRIFANALNNDDIENLRFKIKQEAMKRKTNGYFDYFKYRVVYDVELNYDLIFIFITGLMDDFFRLTQIVIVNFKELFLKLDNAVSNKIENIDIETLNESLDSTHKEILPKISVVGLSGVGKSTIKNLIKKDEISLRHIPTISGDIATIKIGKLEFTLFDFAGQEQYKYLWKGFIKGSDAVLIVTDSTPKNIEKSRFFLELQQKEAPYALTAIIGNKQDIEGAMDVQTIENILGLKTYPMVANRAENREKMIRILADILDFNIDSPLLGGILKKEDVLQFKENVQVETAITQEISQVITKPLEIAKNIEENCKNVYVVPDWYKEMVDEIRGNKEESILKNHFETIKFDVKTLYKQSDYSFEAFYMDYRDYLNNNFHCSNVALKQYLNVQFSELKKSFEKGIIGESASTTEEEIDVVVNALISAFLTKSKPTRYPDFDSFINQSNLKYLDKQTVNKINAYYLRILKKFEP